MDFYTRSRLDLDLNMRKDVGLDNRLRFCNFIFKNICIFYINLW
jgi:hypothetical protein